MYKGDVGGIDQILHGYRTRLSPHNSYKILYRNYFSWSWGDITSFFIGMWNYLFRIKVKRRKENIVFVFKEWDLSSGRGGILWKIYHFVWNLDSISVQINQQMEKKSNKMSRNKGERKGDIFISLCNIMLFVSIKCFEPRKKEIEWEIK